SITNGVHAGTWVDRKVFALAQEHLSDDAVATGTAFEEAATVPAAAIWSTKREMREQLVAETRERLRKSMRTRGSTAAELGWIDDVLDPDILTIGFARRVPTYKRLTLMLSDPERLTKILLDKDRPVQLVIAGKAHPADDTGKRLIQEMVRFTDDPKLRHRIVFLPNYDLAMAQRLYPGCDVWLNNPLRPFEACGTSGMKAALNGALNLSVLDGWWDEWFDGQNGWAIPTADGVEDPHRRDELEASALYDLLENSVVPTFYDTDAEGLPTRWLEMLTHTLTTLGPKVMADRMVRDYTQSLYLPAARAGWAVRDNNYAGARDLAARVAKLRAAWPSVAVERVEVEGGSDSPTIGEHVRVHAYVNLGNLSPDEVKVQVVFGRASESDELTDVETSVLQPVESYEGGRHRFDGELELARTGSLGWTVRVLPAHPLLANDAELGLVVNA